MDGVPSAKELRLGLKHRDSFALHRSHGEGKAGDMARLQALHVAQLTSDQRHPLADESGPPTPPIRRTHSFDDASGAKRRGRQGSLDTGSPAAGGGVDVAAAIAALVDVQEADRRPRRPAGQRHADDAVGGGSPDGAFASLALGGDSGAGKAAGAAELLARASTASSESLRSDTAGASRGPGLGDRSDDDDGDDDEEEEEGDDDDDDDSLRSGSGGGAGASALSQQHQPQPPRTARQQPSAAAGASASSEAGGDASALASSHDPAQQSRKKNKLRSMVKGVFSTLGLRKGKKKRLAEQLARGAGGGDEGASGAAGASSTATSDSPRGGRFNANRPASPSSMATTSPVALATMLDGGGAPPATPVGGASFAPMTPKPSLPRGILKSTPPAAVASSRAGAVTLHAGSTPGAARRGSPLPPDATAISAASLARRPPSALLPSTPGSDGARRISFADQHGRDLAVVHLSWDLHYGPNSDHSESESWEDAASRCSLM